MWCELPFSPETDAEFFAALPAAPAVFMLRPNAAGGEPYVSKTANLRRRLERLLAPAEGRRLSLRERAARVEYQQVGGDFEAGFALYQVLRREFPAKYAERMHLRPAPLLQLLKENRYPRLAMTSRIRSARTGVYFGPFATRAEAEQYGNDSLDFFLLRRCTEELAPDPKFPGCVYSEMKMCLAPCFQGCSDDRYAEEAARVEQYLQTAGHSLLVEIGRQRDEASARLEFEAAAAAHARLDKIKAVSTRAAEIVHRLDLLNGVLLQPSHEAGHIALFRLAGGMLFGPVAFDVSPRPAQPSAVPETALHPRPAPPQAQSMEARLKATLAAIEVRAPRSAAEWMEHLALVKRWYYRSSKVGEIFFEDEAGALPMRRVVRAVGRVFKGEKPAADLSETAGDYWTFRAREAGL
ncbi:MAG: hypothetical protein P4M01_04665 [Acidobacteriota bacterium]|nr:hypothetical protein [Acidobacteriota bacterium]